MLTEQTKYARSQKIGGLKRWVATLFGRNRERQRQAEQAVVLTVWDLAQERAGHVAAYKAAKVRRDKRGMHAARSRAASLHILELRAVRGR